VAIPNKINPLSPVDLGHRPSVQIDNFGNPLALRRQRQKRSSSATASATAFCLGRGCVENSAGARPAPAICHQV